MEENNKENELNSAVENSSETVNETANEVKETVTEEAAPAPAETPVEAPAAAVEEATPVAPVAPAAKEEEATPKAAETPAPVAPAPVNRAIPTANAEPAKPKKGGAKIILPIIAVVAIIAVVVACNFKVIANSFNKLVLGPDKYCQKVLTNYVASSAKDIAKNYGDVNKQSESTKYSYTGSSSIKLSEDALDFLDDQGIEDVDFLADSKATINVQKNENLYAIRATYGTEKKSVLSLSLIIDMDAEMLYIQVPELNKQYLSADISDLLEELSDEELEDLMENINSIEKLSEDEIVDFINRYAAIVINHFEDVEENTVELKVNDVSMKVTSLTVELDGGEITDIAYEIVEELIDDETLEKYFDSIANALDDDDFEWDEIADELDYLLEEIDSDPIDDENILTIEFYVDNKGDIIGFCAEASEDDGKHVDSGMVFYQLNKGSKYALMYQLYEYDEEILTLSGSGSKSFLGGKITGDFTLEIEDHELKFTLKDCKFGIRGVSGTVIIAMEDLIDFFEIDDADDLEDYSLEFTFKFNTKSESFKFAIIDGKEEFMSVTFTFESSSSSKIKAPNEKDCCDMLDEDDLEDWLDEVDVDDVNDALKDMGFPKNFIKLPEV